MLVEPEHVEFGFLAGPAADDRLALVVDVEHERGGLLAAVPEELLEHEGDVAHEVYRVVPDDAARVAERLNRVIASRDGGGIDRVEMINAGFYRNRGGYIVGRAVAEDGNCIPFILALLNDDKGKPKR